MPYWYSSSGSFWWSDQTASTSSTGQMWLPTIATTSTNATAYTYYPSLLGQQSSQAYRPMQEYQAVLLWHQRAMLMGQQQYQNPYNQQLQPQPLQQQLGSPAVLRQPRRSGEEEAAYEARRREHEARLVEIRQRAEEAAQRRRGADERAMQLLRDHLSEAQLATLAVGGYFIVVGQSTGRRYRIRASGNIAGNIDEMPANDNRITHQLCCHMDHTIPSADHYLAQKIMLELAEDDFLRIANRTRVA